MNYNEFEDWYSILNIEQTATTAQIQNAYRKLAKVYHPDKNKSNEAVIMFEKIQIANSTLCNEDKRIIFDSQLLAKKEKKRKEQEMDSTRKKMKQDLFERENQFKKRRENDLNSKRNFEMENELFKQNYINELKKQSQQQYQQQNDSNNNSNNNLESLVIKLKWKSKLGYSKDNILDILSSYGIVDTFTLVDNSSYSIALATFTELESIYQILFRKEDLKKNYEIKVERLKNDSNNSTTTTTFNNGSTTFSTTSSFNNNTHTTTTTTTTTTSSSSSSHSSNNSHSTYTTTSTCNNSNNSSNNIIDEDEEDDILLQMKNFKKK